MQTLRKGSRGSDVRRWQMFLRGQGRLLVVDGLFGDCSDAATREFQQCHALQVDGLVGNQTLGQAALLGFELVPFIEQPGSGFPARPAFPPIVGTAARQSVFGRFAYEAMPTAGDPEAIRLLDNWDRERLQWAIVPQLKGIDGAPRSGRVYLHELVLPQFLALWHAWDDSGLLSRVHSWGGSYVPRFVRGKPGVLSNHAFGTAFDINMAWNGYGAEPAWPGMAGCVFELVPLAHVHGFYWGGHFKKRRDGMHFEFAVPV